MYYIVRQDSEARSTFDEDYSTALAISTSKDLLASQQTNTYCQCMSKLVQGSEPRLNTDEDGLKLEKHLLMVHYKFWCQKLSAEQYSTMAIIPLLLDTRTSDECTINYKVNSTGYI